MEQLSIKGHIKITDDEGKIIFEEDNFISKEGLDNYVKVIYGELDDRPTRIGISTNSNFVENSNVTFNSANFSYFYDIEKSYLGPSIMYEFTILDSSVTDPLIYGLGLVGTTAVLFNIKKLVALPSPVGTSYHVTWSIKLRGEQ